MSSRIISSLMGGAGKAGTKSAGKAGLRRAKVTAIDPATFIVKVHIPSMHEDGKEETGDAMVMQPMMGQAEWGFHFFPEVGDEVIVAFLDGDFEDPIVVGGYWPSKNADIKPTQKVPTTDGDADVDFTADTNDARGIVTRSGHHLLFWDMDGEELIELRSKSGHILTLFDKGGEEKIQLYDKDRKQWLEINVPDKKITIQTDSGELYVKAKTKITMECEDFILNASKTITMDSGKDSKWTSGAKMEQESSSTFDCTAGGTMTLKGGPKIDLNP